MSARRTRACDVAIIGAGPAGSTLAIRLADAGLAVVLIEATTFEGVRIGESLAPDVQPLLREIGVWHHVLATHPLPSWGTRSAWSGPDLEAHSHLVGPYQHGWHVDRCAFDEALARAAMGRGADLRCGIRVQRVTYGSGQWDLVTADGDNLRAGVVADATGRSGRSARLFGARRLVFDHLLGVGRSWRCEPAEGGHILIEAVADGWWYSAPLPGGGLVTLLMTDADICRELRLTSPGRWEAALKRAPLTTERVGSSVPDGAVRSHAAMSGRLRRSMRTDRRPWLAVGDAAVAVDPLTGSGVTRALRTATAATATIAELFDGDPVDATSALERYEADLDREFHQYLHERLDYYLAGPDIDGTFWSRRRAVAERRLTG